MCCKQNKGFWLFWRAWSLFRQIAGFRVVPPYIYTIKGAITNWPIFYFHFKNSTKLKLFNITSNTRQSLKFLFMTDVQWTSNDYTHKIKVGKSNSQTVWLFKFKQSFLWMFFFLCLVSCVTTFTVMHAGHLLSLFLMLRLIIACGIASYFSKISRARMQTSQSSSMGFRSCYPDGQSATLILSSSKQSMQILVHYLHQKEPVTNGASQWSNNQSRLGITALLKCLLSWHGGLYDRQYTLLPIPNPLQHRHAVQCHCRYIFLRDVSRLESFYHKLKHGVCFNL